ncbi:unnamed protein product [Boreogadus saida]
MTLVHLLQLIVKSSFIPPPRHRRVRWPRVVFTMDRLLMWECMGSHHRGSNDESVKYQNPFIRGYRLLGGSEALNADETGSTFYGYRSLHFQLQIHKSDGAGSSVERSPTAPLPRLFGA